MGERSPEQRRKRHIASLERRLSHLEKRLRGYHGSEPLHFVRGEYSALIDAIRCMKDGPIEFAETKGELSKLEGEKG